MSLMESVRYCLTNYFKFSGRGSLSEYWWFVLAIVVAAVIGVVVDMFIGHRILEPLVTWGTAIPSTAAGVRRLHDTDRSGWWLLVGVIPLIGWIVMIVFLARSETLGSNRYGERAET